MLIRIRRSKDLLLQFQSFECSSLFASNSCVYCTTRSNKCGRIGAKWLFFFTFIEECCVVIEKNIDKKLANRISYQIWYNRCLKEKFGRGIQICEEGSKSAVTPALRVPFPVRCLKSTSWKVATDQITYLLQSHLQFPHKSELSRAEVLGEFQGTRFDQL